MWEKVYKFRFAYKIIEFEAEGVFGLQKKTATARIRLTSCICKKGFEAKSSSVPAVAH